MTIGFAGLSHLGIVSSLAAAAKGFEVVGFDPDAALCEALIGGELPVFEPGLDDLLAAHRSRIRFTADPSQLRACQLMVVSPDVPTDHANRSDLASIERIVAQVLAATAPSATVVILSQVPPGLTRRLAAGPASGRTLYYQVETLVFGRAVERALQPERFIVGCAAPETALPAPYAAWLGSFGCPIARMRYESAELAKIAINMFLASSVSTTNTLAELCEAIGAEWDEIAPVLKLDRRIGPHAYLSPGLGIAGGNLERDLTTIGGLAREWGTDTAVVDAWLSNSRARREWPLRTLQTELLSRTEGAPTIAVWGLAYKPDTRSMKNAPSLSLLEALRPYAVRAYDPQAVLSRPDWTHVRQVASALDACQGADALVIMTPWAEFASIDAARIREHLAGRLIIDPYGVLPVSRCEALGLRHVRLGSPSRAEQVA